MTYQGKNIQAPGASCGESSVVNGRKRKCKHHFDRCYFSKEDVRATMQPTPGDGRHVPHWVEPGETLFDMLNWSLEMHWCRADFPTEAPARFQREQRIHPPTGAMHFGWVPIWSDGTRASGWSYSKGIGGDQHHRSAVMAMRTEVQKQIDDVRFGAGPGLHVHHRPPNTFANLAKDFAASLGLEVRDIQTCSSDPSQPFDCVMADRDQAEAWQVFHAENADLELLTPEEHAAAHAAGGDE